MFEGCCIEAYAAGAGWAAGKENWACGSDCDCDCMGCIVIIGCCIGGCRSANILSADPDPLLAAGCVPVVDDMYIPPKLALLELGLTACPGGGRIAGMAPALEPPTPTLRSEEVLGASALGAEEEEDDDEEEEDGFFMVDVSDPVAPKDDKKSSTIASPCWPWPAAPEVPAAAAEGDGAL